MLNEKITHRYAAASDYLLLAELGRRTYAETFAKDNTPENMAAYLASAFGPEKQAAELADPHSRFLIAEIDAQPVGYARLHTGPAPACISGQQPLEIVRFYSVKEYIGQGVGAYLMQACLDEATRQGCDVAWLDVWEENRRAIAFYQKWGFAQVGWQEYRLGEDVQHDWLMQKELRP